VDCNFSGTCDKCKKQGHMAKVCRSAKSDKPRTHKKGDKKVNLAVADVSARDGRESRDEFQG
jgi:hypothetical protein